MESKNKMRNIGTVSSYGNTGKWGRLEISGFPIPKGAVIQIEEYFYKVMRRGKGGIAYFLPYKPIIVKKSV